jgi:hypothetical protein
MIKKINGAIWSTIFVFLVSAGLLINFSKIDTGIIIILGIAGLFVILNLILIKLNIKLLKENQSFEKMKVRRRYWIQSLLNLVIGLALFIYTCQSIGLDSNLLQTGISIFLIVLGIVFYELGYARGLQ